MEISENPISFSSTPLGKVLRMPRSEANAERIRNFLKTVGVTKDYRKHFLKGELIPDQWQESSTKHHTVCVYAFVGNQYISVLVVVKTTEMEEITNQALVEYFT